jgi:hypothetical protein
MKQKGLNVTTSSDAAGPTSIRLTSAVTEEEVLDFLRQQGITDLETLVHKMRESLDSTAGEDDEPDALDIYNTPWNTFLHTLEAE